MSFRESAATVRSFVRRRALDAVANRRWLGREPRFLVLRHPRMFEWAYERDYLPWLERNLPEVRARFELQLVPGRLRNPSRYVLHVPWLQDPLRRWSPRAHAQANRLAAACDRHEIPVINRVDQAANATKIEGTERIRTSGLRTPHAVRIDDVAAFRNQRIGIGLPTIVREDEVHGGRMRRVKSESHLEKIKLTRFEKPIAMEFIDVRSPSDGLVRKYRYLVAGDVGVPLSMHICESWRTQGKKHVIRRDLIEEECAFASSPLPDAPRFVQAAKALGVDIAAFDYGVTPEGEIVVWEANPYPNIRLTTGRGVYRSPATVRVFAAITRLYLRAAQLEVPAKVDDLLDHRAVYGGGELAPGNRAA